MQSWQRTAGKKEYDNAIKDFTEAIHSTPNNLATTAAP